MAAAGLAAVLEPLAATPDTVAAAATCALAHRRPAVDAARNEIATLPHPDDALNELVARLG